MELVKPRCPKCRGSYVVPDYQPSGFLLRLLLIQNLMCDRCNYPFRAFALPLRRPRPSQANLAK
jgi:C4-type Zn-finger protein